MNNVNVDFEGKFVLIEREGALVAKVDLATVTLATVQYMPPSVPHGFVAYKSRELILVADGVTVRVHVRDEERPEPASAHSAYGILRLITDNMP